MVTLEYIHKSINACKHTSQSLCNVKPANSLYSDADPQPSKEDIIIILREELFVEILYKIEILSGPVVLFRLLCDYGGLKDLE